MSGSTIYDKIQLQLVIEMQKSIDKSIDKSILPKMGPIRYEKWQCIKDYGKCKKGIIYEIGKGIIYVSY